METATKETGERQQVSVRDKMLDYLCGAACITTGLIIFGYTSFFIQMYLPDTFGLPIAGGALGQIFGVFLAIVGVLEVTSIKRFRRLEERLNALSPEE